MAEKKIVTKVTPIELPEDLTLYSPYISRKYFQNESTPTDEPVFNARFVDIGEEIEVYGIVIPSGKLVKLGLMLESYMLTPGDSIGLSITNVTGRNVMLEKGFVVGYFVRL